MMLDAVTFDLGCARSSLLVFPEASGLAPLTLPDEFLRGQSQEQQPELSPDSVRRFETAMSAKPPIPPSVVKSVMACMIPESRKSEIASVVTSVPVASGDGPAVGTTDTVVEKASTLSADKPVASVVQTPTVVTVERPVVPAVEVPKVVTVETPEMPAVETPKVVTIEKPATVVLPTEHTSAPVVVANLSSRGEAKEQPVAASNIPATPAAPIVTDASVAKPVAIVEPPVAVDKPIVASVEHSVRVASPDRPAVQVRATAPEEPIVLVEKTPIQSADKPVASVVQVPTAVTVETPEMPAVEAPKVVTIEKPAAVVLPPEHTVVPAVVENLNSRVEAKEQPVAASSIPVIPAAPIVTDASVAKPVAMVEPPVAVDKPIGAPVEHSVRVASPDRPAVQVRATAPEEPIVLVEKTPIQSADKPVASVVQAPTAVTVEKPEMPAVEVPRGVTVESQVVSAIETPKVVTGERPAVAPAENPTIAAIERPVIAVADKPVISASEHPTVATVEVPKVVIVEKPVTVVLPPKRTVVPAVVENLNSRGEAKEQPVAVDGIPATPAAPIVTDASVAKPVAIAEPLVAVDKPIGVPVEHSVRVAVEESGVVSVNAPLPAGSVLRSVDENPVVASPGRPAVQVHVTTPEEPIVLVEKTPIQSADKPVASVVQAPTVVTVERPAVPAVEAPKVVTVEGPVVSSVEAPKVVMVERPVVQVVEVPKVVAVEEPVVAMTDTSTIVTIEKPVIAGAEKPVISSVEHPTVATVEIPKVVTIEKPATVVLPPEHTVIPAVVENLNSRVEAKEQPVAASSIPATPAAPIVTDASVAKPVAMVEPPVAVDKPIGAPVEHFVRVAAGESKVAAVGSTIPAESVLRPATENPVSAPPGQTTVQVIVPTPAEPNGIIEKTPVVPAERPGAEKVDNPKIATTDKTEEKAVAASAHVVVTPAAVEASAPQVLPVAPEVAAASAASARTEALVETVNQVVEAVVGQILVTPGITQGECEIKIMLKPTVLDGSEVTMSAKDGTLTVNITPATQEASAAAASALPRLEIALAEHAPAFHHVSVALQLKKGNRNEAV